MILHKIIQGQDLYTGLQTFTMTRKLILGEALRVFEQKTRYMGTEANAKNELVIKDMIYRFFLPKALHILKRYLQRGLYKPRAINIRELICRIYKMVDYLDKFPLFGARQRLSYNKILELVEFSLQRE